MPDFSHESRLEGPVIGIDEVGRGPWAGPVTVCAVCLAFDKNWIPNGIDDSKKLSERKREDLAKVLMVAPHYHHVISISAKNIDRLGVVRATLLGMTSATRSLSNKLIKAGLSAPRHALVDGNLSPPDMPIPSTEIVRGDSESISIAAASIIAKTVRDRIMRHYHSYYPGYGWNKNKGYGTKTHVAGLLEYGISEHHRRTFKPIKRYID